MNMDKKSDEFKAWALDLIGSRHKLITSRDRAILWRLAASSDELTDRDMDSIHDIAVKVGPQGVVA